MYFFYGKKKDDKKVDTSEKPIKQSVHSPNFNKRIENAVDHYLAMKDAFVNADTAAVKMHASDFVQALDSINADEMIFAFFTSRLPKMCILSVSRI